MFIGNAAEGFEDHANTRVALPRPQAKRRGKGERGNRTGSLMNGVSISRGLKLWLSYLRRAAYVANAQHYPMRLPQMAALAPKADVLHERKPGWMTLKAFVRPPTPFA